MRYVVALCIFLASLMPSFAQQAGTVSNMPFAGTPLSGSELLYVVQSGISKKTTVTTLINGIGNYVIVNVPNINLAVAAPSYNPNDTQPFNMENLAVGAGALGGSPNSTENLAIGWDALNVFGSTSCTACGQNVALGAQALPFDTNGEFLVAVGTAAGRSLTTGTGSVIIGHGAAAGDDTLVGIGFNNSPATGVENVNIGTWSGQEQTTADAQVCVGINSCLSIATGQDNTAIGFGSLTGNPQGYDNYASANAVSYSTCIGIDTCYLTTGGFQSAYANGSITFSPNPANGTTLTLGTSTWTFVTSGATGNQTNIQSSLAATLAQLVSDLNASGDAQVSLAKYWVFNGTGLDVQFKVSGSGGNTFVLNTNVSGTTVYGTGSPNYYLLQAVTTANPILAIGYEAAFHNLNGAENTAIGFAALFTSVADAGNTAVGNGALTTLNGGSGNTALGDSAMSNATTAASNVAVGYHALLATTTGDFNVAVGQLALAANTTAGGEVALGDAALLANTTGNGNTAIGYEALEANTTGSYGTVVGSQAAILATGNYNTVVGAGAMAADTTGNGNTVVGANAEATGNFSNIIVIGQGAQASADQQVVLGDGTKTATLLFGAITNSGMPSSAGAGGLYICVDTSGNFYKKSACP